MLIRSIGSIWTATSSRLGFVMCAVRLGGNVIRGLAQQIHPLGAEFSFDRWPVQSPWMESHSPSRPSPDLIRGLSRASTSFWQPFGKDVDGRDKPGHDLYALNRRIERSLQVPRQ